MWPNPLENKYLFKFTEEILNGKLHFLCSMASSTHLTCESTLTPVSEITVKSIFGNESFLKLPTSKIFFCVLPGRTLLILTSVYRTCVYCLYVIFLAQQSFFDRNVIRIAMSLKAHSQIWDNFCHLKAL